jgi:hypothetical protein
MEDLRNIILTVIVLLVFFAQGDAQVAYSTSMPVGSNMYFKNITHSDHQLEMNPRFIENGTKILFLIFTGNPESPKPWDYMLSSSDREGHSIYYITSQGVLDYNVLSDEFGVLVLKAITTAENWDIDAYEDIREWELWYLDLENRVNVLLESSKGLPLSEGYKILGLADLPNHQLAQFSTQSPRRTTRLLVQREEKEEKYFYKFYVEKGVGRKVIFTTEAWQSYSHNEWWPAVVWLDESSFITVRFQSIPDERFPQSEGLFSIVRVDLNEPSETHLFSDFALKPFPKIALHPSASTLYFHKVGKAYETTELWRLNLVTKLAEMIYSVEGDLGDVRFASDGSSLVFTQLIDHNFDIIRVDLEP